MCLLIWRVLLIDGFCVLRFVLSSLCYRHRAMAGAVVVFCSRKMHRIEQGLFGSYRVERHTYS
jgi:hypothetical protein